MWYYNFHQKPFGPVSKETIADALKTGLITAQTLVWREGWAEWRRLGETELGQLLASSLPTAANGTMSTPPPVNYGPPGTMILPQYKKVDPVKLGKLFWWWFGLILFVIPFTVSSLFTASQPWVVGLVCAFEIPYLAALVLQYILTYRYWQVVQDGFARTSPGKAVGFLFIPFFNYYWMYVAYHGLAIDMNGYIDRHFQANYNNNVRKTHPALSLIYMIMLWVYMLFTIIFGIVILSQSFTTFASPADLSGMMQPYMIGIYISVFVQMAIMIAMFFDIHHSARSILQEEGKAGFNS